MRKTYLAILSLLITAATSAQCPHIAGIFADACGQENRNEFLFLLNGPTALNVNNLAITFPTNGSVTVANTNDFSAPAGTSATLHWRLPHSCSITGALYLPMHP